MSPTELERPLEAGALREIERSLYGKLKAHRLSDSFIARCGEEALQEGLVEYFRAVKNGQEIDNRDAFVVKAAFFRAIDKLRREARESDSAAAEALLERGRFATPASDEVAIEHLAAEELHKAIGTLGAEERQALRLHYFEQLSNEKSAEILYCSERTFRRRLTKALDDLSRRLGVPVPEPDSELAIEVGLAAWVSLAGAKVVPANGLIDHAAAAIDATLHLPASILGRARDLTARLLASDASEKVTALAGGPAARAGGAFCTGALALCLVTGAVGPGIGGLDIGGEHSRTKTQNAAPRHPLAKDASRPTAASEVQPPQSASGNSFGQAATGSGEKTIRPSQVQRDRHQVKQQTRSLARVGNESTSSSPPTPPVSASSTSTEQTEASAAPASRNSSESGGAAQAKQQFGAFK